MKLRKFEILRVEVSPGCPGPDRTYNIYYKAIKKKVWVESKLYILAKNEKEYRIYRFGI